MIVILSSIPRERVALAIICEQRGWVYSAADSIREFKRIIRRLQPRVLLVRHKLSDGYSDDAIGLIASGGNATFPKILVLLPANSPVVVEVRQIALGADCVQRDPVRAEVIRAYIAKYQANFHHSALKGNYPLMPAPFSFCGAVVDPVERTFEHGHKVIHLTPREIELSQLLAESRGLVTYETLYADILGRRFQGDTSNLRVLLKKLDSSIESAGIQLRRWVEVIPKFGYRYRTPTIST